MAQRGLGFNFLYIIAWFNLTWDFGAALDRHVKWEKATTKKHLKKLREIGLKKVDQEMITTYILNAKIFKFPNENINNNKSKSHLPAARCTTTTTTNNNNNSNSQGG